MQGYDRLQLATVMVKYFSPELLYTFIFFYIPATDVSTETFVISLQ